jgi:hypothetical protein
MFSPGLRPYSEVPTKAELINFVCNGLRLSRPQKCPQNIYEIMLKCWSSNPEDRPTFSELHELLKKEKNTVSIETRPDVPLVTVFDFDKEAYAE